MNANIVSENMFLIVKFGWKKNNFDIFLTIEWIIWSILSARIGLLFVSSMHRILKIYLEITILSENMSNIIIFHFELIIFLSNFNVQ